MAPRAPPRRRTRRHDAPPRGLSFTCRVSAALIFFALVSFFAHLYIGRDGASSATRTERLAAFHWPYGNSSALASTPAKHLDPRQLPPPSPPLPPPLPPPPPRPPPPRRAPPKSTSWPWAESMARRLAAITSRDRNVTTTSADAAAAFRRDSAAHQSDADGGGSARAGATKASPAAGRTKGRMNVVFICADDFRSNTMIYGKEQTYTPNLQRLAARGVVFDRAYVGCHHHLAIITHCHRYHRRHRPPPPSPLPSPSPSGTPRPPSATHPATRL